MSNCGTELSGSFSWRSTWNVRLNLSRIYWIRRGRWTWKLFALPSPCRPLTGNLNRNYNTKIFIECELNLNSINKSERSCYLSNPFSFWGRGNTSATSYSVHVLWYERTSRATLYFCSELLMAWKSLAWCKARPQYTANISKAFSSSWKVLSN